MSEDDGNLKRMFDAQRQIDKALAPGFDDMHVTSLAADTTSPAPFTRKIVSLPVSIVVSVIALFAVCFFSWLNFPRPGRSSVSSTSRGDLQRLNQACDSLLDAIQAVDSRTIAQPSRENEQEMQWPTGTDSLMPFAALTMNTRTSP